MEIKNIVWDEKSYKKFRNYLISFEDIDYKNFHCRLCDTKYEIIGIRVPIMKKIADEILKTNIEEYIKSFKPIYYEEIFICGLVISGLKDSSLLDKYLMNFIDYVDNWAICDSFCSNMKIIKNKLGKYWIYFNSLIDNKKEFYTRISLVIFKNYYINDQYIDRVLYIVSNIKSDYYYVNMASAWLLQEAYIKYSDKIIELLKSNKLSRFVQNKTISKICDSNRVKKEEKEKLKKYRL